MADVADGGQFDGYDEDSGGKRHVKIGEQKGQGVPDAAGGGHQAADQAAHPGMSTAGERAIVGEGFGEAHGDARSHGSR